MHNGISCRLIFFLSIFFLGVGFLGFPAASHGGVEDEEPGLSDPPPAHLSGTPLKLPDPLIFIKVSSAVLLAFILFISFSKSNFPQHHKKFLFLALAIPVVLSTLYLAGHTVYKNISSVTKGPVHWHADYELWICGEQQELRDPEGFENKVGTNVLHEHDDNRIHIEGVVEALGDVSLASYFSSIGGLLSHHELRFPSEKGMITVKDGTSCPGGADGLLKVYINGNLAGEPESYVPAPEINVPPGDCIIIDFSPG